MTGPTEPWVAEVIAFWFGELNPRSWFERSDAVDEAIRRRFARLHAEIALQAPDDPPTEAQSTLARIIVLDQFPRNMFRGTARAFATDAQALHLAGAAVAAGLDAGLPGHRRLFMYLPFEHSERAADQAMSVALFERLGDPALLGYAVRHKEIIDRFGRFPHRNASLGRASTPAEIAFLAEPGSSF